MSQLVRLLYSNSTFTCDFVWIVYMILATTCQTPYKIQLDRIVKPPINRNLPFKTIKNKFIHSMGHPVFVKNIPSCQLRCPTGRLK